VAKNVGRRIPRNAIISYGVDATRSLRTRLVYTHTHVLYGARFGYKTSSSSEMISGAAKYDDR